MIRRHSTGETDHHHRFCGYDRANTGNSDEVPGPLDGKRWDHTEWKDLEEQVDRFAPGVLKEVESPHYMEAAVPDRIAQEPEKVIAAP